jgi:hypothetical protein
VTSSTSGTLEPGSAASSTYRLTLRGLGARVGWFTDHPTREAGTEDTQGFVKSWSGYGFDTDPPNVALVLDSTGPGKDVAVGSLSAPSFDAGTDTLRADFTVFSGQRLAQVGGALADKARRARSAVLPDQFGDSSLFVDDATQQYIAANSGRVPTDTVGINATVFPTVPSPMVDVLPGNGPDGSPAFTSGLWLYGTLQVPLANATFSGPVVIVAQSMAGIDMSGAHQVGATRIVFNVIDLSDADLVDVDLPNATFMTGVDLDGADLRGAVIGSVTNPVTDTDTTCTDGKPGPCDGPNLTSS